MQKFLLENKSKLNNMMLSLVAVVFLTECVALVLTKCAVIPSGLYCTNLEKDEYNKTLIFETDSETEVYDVQVVYLRNSSGEISQETFSNFTTINSIDIEFCDIDKFDPRIDTMNTLYLMYNSRFPNLTADFMEDCCRNVTILFLVGNSGLHIENGTFKYMDKLTHLTISQQNITHLSKDFFEGLGKLAYLNLKNNGILSIEEDSFMNLTELNHLVLSGNNFTKLEMKTFETFTSLEALEMHMLNITDFNISIFHGQKELKVLELPKTIIKKKIELSEIIKTLPKLETFGFLNEDKEDPDVKEFVAKSKSSGFMIKFSNISDL